MRILYLIGVYPAINHYYLLAEIRHLRRLGWEIRTASISQADRPHDQLTAEEKAEAAKTWVVKATPLATILWWTLRTAFTRPKGFFRSLYRAWRMGAGSFNRQVHHLIYWVEALMVGQWMEREGLTHVHASFTATVACLASYCFPITVSIGVYGYGELYDPKGSCLSEKIEAAFFLRSISQHGVNELMLASSRKNWGKLEHVPLGIDIANYEPRPVGDNGTICLITVGRLSPEKGQFLLLQAIAKLAGPVRLVIVGDGPDRAELEAEVKSLGLSERVVFEGRVSGERLMALYAQADAFVLTSLSEGIPMVLMEAMAMTIPCVAPRITGIPELVEEDKNGWLYTPADVVSLVDTLQRVIADPEGRRRRGDKAREKVVNAYDMEKNTARFGEVLSRRLGCAQPVLVENKKG